MSSYAPLFDSSKSLSPKRNYSPGKLLASLAALIFLAETATMVLLYFLKLPGYSFYVFLDGIIMLVLILPGLYFLQLKPILRKIEEQEKTEKALRTSEAYLKKILEVLPVGVWIVNKNGDVMHGNRAGQEIWAGIRYVGIDGYAAYKSRWADTGEWIKPHEWAAVRAISKGETSIDEEINIEAFDGTHKTILNSSVPIFDENNHIQGAVVVNQDITLRRRMEKENARTHELLEKSFNSIHTMIAYLDQDFHYVRVNQAYAEAAGQTIEYFRGKDHFDLYTNEENRAIFRQVVETGQPFIEFEKPFISTENPDRGMAYLDWSLQPVMGSNNKVEGVVLSLINVTRRKLAEMQLERQNQELRQLTDTEHRQRVLAEGLVQSVVVLNSSLELDQVLCSVLEQTRKAIPFDGADILLVKGKIWRVAAFLGFENHPAVSQYMENWNSIDGYPLLQQVQASHQMLVLDSVKDHPAWRSNPEMTWVGSFAAVPLEINGETMGIVELYGERPGAFDLDIANRLAAFAAPAALAIHNARLYQAESEARQIAETMRGAAQALSQTLDLDHVINTLRDHLQMIVHCETLGITLMEGEDRWQLRTLRGYHIWADRNPIPTAPLDEISMLIDLNVPHKIIILPNKTYLDVVEQASDPAQIHSWTILPILINGKVIGFVEIGKAGKELLRTDETQWAEALVSEASVAIQNAWLFEQVRSSSIRLQSLARKLVEIQEKERFHIARELHDEAGQILSSLKISLGRLEQDPGCPPPIRQRLLDMKNVADSVLEDLHRLAMDLRPAALDHLGLVAALAQLANQINSAELSVKFKALNMEGERLEQEVETSLYRIVQEALTNILHHAHASSVGILLERSGSTVKLFIEDDGSGFAPDQVESSDHLGLVGMRERAEMFGGSLVIESSPENGTSIIVEVPDAGSYTHHG